MRNNNGTSWFFGIGINDYFSFSKLNNAVKDVNDLITVLKSKYHLPEKNIFTLFDEEANRKNIISHLDLLCETVGPNDKIIISYSGHGTIKNEKGFWIPYDGEIGVLSSYIRNSTIRDYMEDFKSLHSLLIVDSCFSGSLLVRNGGTEFLALNDLEKIKSRWVICSGRHDEVVSDGKPGANSPFMKSILTVLLSNSLPKLGIVKVIDEVIGMTRTQYNQIPEGCPLFGVGHQGGQYIFSQELNENSDWKKCIEMNTPSMLRSFIARYPTSKNREEALNKLLELEKKSWLTAKTVNHISLYQVHNIDFPNGKYEDLAITFIERLEKSEESLWNKVLSKGNKIDFEKFIKENPKSKYLDVAKKHLKKERKAEIAYQNKLHPRTDGIYIAQIGSPYGDGGFRWNYLRFYDDGTVQEWLSGRSSNLKSVKKNINKNTIECFPYKKSGNSIKWTSKRVVEKYFIVKLSEKTIIKKHEILINKGRLKKEKVDGRTIKNGGYVFHEFPK